VVDLINSIHIPTNDAKGTVIWIAGAVDITNSVVCNPIISHIHTQLFYVNEIPQLHVYSELQKPNVRLSTELEALSARHC
jgi:hypothetical protein